MGLYAKGKKVLDSLSHAINIVCNDKDGNNSTVQSELNKLYEGNENNNITDDSTLSDGYYKLPNGLILQWGIATTEAKNDNNYTFKIPFTTIPIITTGQRYNETGTSTIPQVFNISATGFSANVKVVSGNSYSAREFSWFAIGY